MFDSRNGHCWLVEIQYGDRFSGTYGWTWLHYVLVATRRQGRVIVSELREEGEYADARVRRVTIHGGW